MFDSDDEQRHCVWEETHLHLQRLLYRINFGHCPAPKVCRALAVGILQVRNFRRRRGTRRDIPGLSTAGGFHAVEAFWKFGSIFPRAARTPPSTARSVSRRTGPTVCEIGTFDGYPDTVPKEACLGKALSLVSFPGNRPHLAEKL